MADPWSGLAGGRSLHDWLVDSAYVRARSDESVRKKGRSRRGKQRTDRESCQEAGMNMAREHDADRSATAHLGNRRYRRWINDKLLHELSGPLDAEEIGRLFTPPPWGAKDWKSPLEQLLDGSASRSLWESFRSVDMDKQEIMLGKFAQAADANSKQNVKLATSNGATDDSSAVLAEASWRGVQRHARDALWRSADWPIVERYEDKLLEFVRDLEEVAEGCEERRAMEPLLLSVDNGYHRLLIHGLSQFHGLLSATVESAEGLKVMVIRAPKQKARKPSAAAACEEEPMALSPFAAAAAAAPAPTATTTTITTAAGPSSSLDSTSSSSSDSSEVMVEYCGGTERAAQMKLSHFLIERRNLNLEVSAAA